MPNNLKVSYVSENEILTELSLLDSFTLRASFAPLRFLFERIARTNAMHRAVSVIISPPVGSDFSASRQDEIFW